MGIAVHKHKLFFLTGILVLASLVFMIERLEEFPAYQPGPKIQVSIADKQFALQVADSEEKRARGLSGQMSLAPNEGMLFVFEPPDIQCFWMKDMNFALDILWFDENNRLIHQERNVQPASYPQSYCPRRSAKYVVEVMAGKSEEFNWRIGDMLQIEKQ